MPDLELSRPLFKRRRTRDLIDAIAHVDRLAIYAGAGVTADQTGLTWKELIVRLLTGKGVSREAASLIVDTYGTVNAGSIVSQVYMSDPEPNDTSGSDGLDLATAMRPIIYNKLYPLGGRTSECIAQLCAELRGQGRPYIEVLTTNYDELLRIKINEVHASWTQRGGLSLAATEPVNVQFLHGLLPKNDSITDFPVISEEDYALRSAQTEERLQHVLSSASCLIVGSGLSDRPLLNALLRTKDEAKRLGSRRVVLVPRDDLGAAGDSPESNTRLQFFIKRLDHLGLQAVFVDYYSQVAQFIAETRQAATLSAGEYGRSPISLHESRLETWWRAWKEFVESAADAQDTHHNGLAAILEEFREGLDDHTERMKLDLWVRWDTGVVDERHFILWSSSYAQYRDPHLSREAHIERDPQHPVVRTFRLGRTLIEDRLSERWNAFIALPLVPDAVDAMVGVIIIATMTDAKSSVLQADSIRTQPLFRLRQECMRLLVAPFRRSE